AQASRIATTSACAVGSWARVTRLTPSKRRPPGISSTAPKGPPPAPTFSVASPTARLSCSEAALVLTGRDPSAHLVRCPGSQPRGDLDGLTDRPLRIELGGHVRAADHVHPR